MSCTKPHGKKWYQEVAGEKERAHRVAIGKESYFGDASFGQRRLVTIIIIKRKVPAIQDGNRKTNAQR